MKPTVWHVMIAMLLIAYVIGAAALVAYVLYGPGFEVKVPDFFGLGSATSTLESTGSDASAPTPMPVPAPLLGYSGTLFECADDKALKAEFLEGKVNLALSDGRQISLPEIAPATEGETRYANTNESFVFWNKDNIASIAENGATTYSNCSTTISN